jgi:hypothetical protein
MITLSTGKLRPPSSLTAVTVSSLISMPCTWIGWMGQVEYDEDAPCCVD